MAQNGIFNAFAAAWGSDHRQYALPARLRHALRRLPALTRSRDVAALLCSPALQAHAAAEGMGDPLFVLSHRHYLAQGLGRRDRIGAALCHYRTVDRHIGPAARQALDTGAGLPLWHDNRAGAQFVLRLTRGRDVAFEGGLSLLLEIDDAPLSVLSFSFVPPQVLGLAEDQAAIPFLTRKQTSGDKAARALFDRSFDRCNPAGMTMAGFAALAARLGHDRAIGIAAARHPSWSAAHATAFVNSYDAFWQTLGGQPAGPYGWRIPLPLLYAPVAGMEAAKRARALRRRAHLDAVGIAAAHSLAAVIA